VDFVTLDDGEQPLLALIEHVRGLRPARRLCRTLAREAGAVRRYDDAAPPELPAADPGTPRYAGLPLDRYLSLCELPNPMLRLWSSGRWNKLMLARGCYWKRCAFCDTALPYIARFIPDTADRIVERMEAVRCETGQSGFHFVDEAAPPALLGRLADRLIARRPGFAWWTNIRFEPAFTPALAQRLAQSGCIAVTGGLETAHDRTLGLMRKGITTAQAARVIRALAEAGIGVHAYLIYGFPTQTAQEAVDALDLVRRLFAAGWIQSAYWHRFTLTVHSRIARTPERFGIRIPPAPPAPFARNELAYEEPGAPDWEPLGRGLRKAVYNYVHGVGLDENVRAWFEVPVPRPRKQATALAGQAQKKLSPRSTRMKHR